MEHFSVLMSVYIREQATLLDRALQSILVNQSVKPSELVLVEDGPLTDGLYHVIDKYKQIFPELVSVKLPQNGGLGNALNAGMKQCRYEWIARMYNRENETYNFLKRNVQFSLFFHPIKAKAFNHHLSGN